MNAHRIETVLTDEWIVTLRGLPFKSGTALEIIILERDNGTEKDAGEAEHVAEWLNASKRSLQDVWDNDEDAVYNNL